MQSEVGKSYIEISDGKTTASITMTFLSANFLSLKCGIQPKMLHPKLFLLIQILICMQMLLRNMPFMCFADEVYLTCFLKAVTV